MSIDRTRETFGRAVMLMAMDEGSLRRRLRQATLQYILLLRDSEVPRNLRQSFGRLGSLIAPAQCGDTLTAELEPLSDDDVRRAVRLIVELNSHLNTTWWSADGQLP